MRQKPGGRPDQPAVAVEADRGSQIPWMAAFAAIFVLGALMLWWPLARTFFHIEINYNEGWNSYVQQTVANGGKIYGEPPRLSYTNYPPLSFYVVGMLGRLTHNVTATGRVISLVSLFVVALLSALTIRRATGDWRAGIYTGLALVVFIGIFKPDRIGMNDPHLLAMAFGALGVYLVVRDPESNVCLFGSAVAFAVSVFTKQTLLAFPAAAAAYLFVFHRRRFVPWAATGAGAAVALLVFTYVEAGSHFLDHLGMPRTYSFDAMVGPFSTWLLLFNLGVAVALAWSITWPEEPFSRLLVWMFGLGTIAGLIYLTGSGSDSNLMFDSVVAMSLCLGRLSAHLPGWLSKTPRPNALLAVLLCTPFLASIIPVITAWPVLVAQARTADKRQQEYRQVIDFIRAQPGHAICESLLACFDAGKPKIYDPYATVNLINTGKLRDVDVAVLVAQRKFGVIQLDRPGTDLPISIHGSNRFTATFMQQLAQNYREGLSVSEYIVFVPR